MLYNAKIVKYHSYCSRYLLWEDGNNKIAIDRKIIIYCFICYKNLKNSKNSIKIYLNKDSLNYTKRKGQIK